ncbi:MAG TPA: efflux RND transporter periplasmic adaptor subunit [Usitatibacter sp.]|nr:efflux RND transporter periplasmic adaptor subunit [Usitatibacter sp.]
MKNRFLPVLLAALVAGCSSKANTPPPAPAPVPARVVEVQPRTVPIVVEGVGQVEGSKEVEVRARVAGTLKSTLYKEGDVVKPGTTLFQIDREPFEIALAQSRSLLAQETARNEQQKREAARLKDLVGQRAISQKEFDDATSNAKLSEAALDAARARLREAELNLSYTTVTAPVGGVTGRAQHSDGSLITTSGPDGLLTTISQMDPVWVRFSLSESDLAKLPGGRLAKDTSPEIRLVMPDGTAYPTRGRLNFTASQIDPKLATLQLRAEFPNATKGLLPGQFVRVQIVAGKRDNVFLVPQVAVTQTETGYLVFVLDAQSKAQIRQVKVGDWLGKDWTVLDGLKGGDKVVVDNLMKLRPGSTVAPVAEAAPAKTASSR